MPSEQALLVREEISEDIEIEGGSNIYLRSPQVGLKNTLTVVILSDPGHPDGHERRTEGVEESS